MPEWHAARAANAAAISEALSPLADEGGPIRLAVMEEETEVTIGSRHAWYKYYAYVRKSNLNERWDRDRIAGVISAAGVPCMQGSCSEMYLEKAFVGNNLRPKKLMPVAKALGETSLMFLVHPGMGEKLRADLTKVPRILLR